MDLGAHGIWTFQLDLVPAAQGRDHVTELEELGFGAIWIPEALGREAFTNAALLLAGGTDITVATGIASIWARDAMAAASAQRTLTEAYPNRFLLGLGVSHRPLVEDVRGHDYRHPLAAMRRYLDAMDQAPFAAAQPVTTPQRALAALGPRMLALAAERTAGAHTYFVPPEHTAIARDTLGDEAVLAVEQAVVFETGPTRAREIARTHTGTYTGLPNYANNLKRLGMGDDDLADGGSDRLVDTVVAWGTMDTVLERIRAHHDAGADHVCIQVITDEGDVPIGHWRELGTALAR